MFLKRELSWKSRRETDDIMKLSTPAKPPVTSCSGLPSKAQETLFEPLDRSETIHLSLVLRWNDYKCNETLFLLFLKKHRTFLKCPKSIEVITTKTDEEEKWEWSVDWKIPFFSLRQTLSAYLFMFLLKLPVLQIVRRDANQRILNSSDKSF